MNVATIISAFDGVLGWRNTDDLTNGYSLTGDIASASSGMWYNDVHAYLTFNNIVAAAPDFIAINDDDQNAADADLVEWLTNQTHAGIIEAIRMWVNQKSKMSTAVKVLDNTQLFRTTGKNTRLDVNNGHLVGFEILPRKSKNVSYRVYELGLYLTSAVTLNLYLFKSDQASPLKTQSFVFDTPNSMKWIKPSDEWIIEGEGSYFICYDQNDLGAAQSINSTQEYSGQYFSDRHHYYPRGKYFQATGFRNVNADASALWDVSTNGYTVSTNYGMNLKMQTRCDYTNFVTENKEAFYDLVWLTTAIKMLEIIATKAAANPTRFSLNVDPDRIIYAIEGDTRGTNMGLRARQMAALESVMVDESRMDRLCLPCKNKSVRRTNIV
jgi:hypothetical protein